MARRGGAPGGTRQRKHWHGTANTEAEFTGAATAILCQLDVTDPATILRTLGSVVAGPDEAGVVAGDGAIITVGLGVVSTDAATVGATAVPDPSNEPEFDWLFWYPMILQFPVGVNTAGNSFPLVSGMRLDVNSKAMRRVSHGESLLLIGQYENSSGNPPVDVFASLRILIGE